MPHRSVPPQTASTLKQRRPAKSGFAQLEARSWAVLIVGAVVIVFAIIIASTGDNKDKPVLPQPSPSSASGAEGHANPSPGAGAASQPRRLSPPPKYRIFKQSSVNSTSVVVAENTTDEQLRSLLWFLREKVRSHDFKAIGLTVPTSINFGKKNWDQGLIAIYKGAKCADEEYATKGLGPCGYGEHSAASYQWGIDRQADQDSGDLVAPDGNLTVVFDYKDGWNPPPDVQAKLQAEQVQQKAGEEEKAEKNKTDEDLFATMLQQRLSGLGFHMDVFRGSEADELVVNSELFKDDSGRVQFLSSVLPKWRKDLCRVGYRTIRLKDGMFSLGDNYSIGCH
jgi:hypothetical protein